MQGNNYQSANYKKEEYKKYLEKTGVSDALTKVLVALYEEPDRPKNAIEYIKKHLGGSSSNSYTDTEQLKNENKSLKQEIRDLENKIGELKIQMEKMEEERQLQLQLSGLEGAVDMASM